MKPDQASRWLSVAMLFFMLGAVVLNAQSALNFLEVGSGSPTNQFVISAFGDYDSDGDLDIASAWGGQVMVSRNNSGSFAVAFPPWNAWPSELAWVDFNSDGRLDIGQGGWRSSGYNPGTLVSWNTGTQFSVPITLGMEGLGDGAVAWGDYDNDGDPDLLVTGDPDTYHSPSAKTMLLEYHRIGIGNSAGLGIYTNTAFQFPALVRSTGVWGDFDNDGDLDLVIAGQSGQTHSSAEVHFLRNDGNGAATKRSTPFHEVPTPLPPITRCMIASGDYNNDGWLDLFLAGINTNGDRIARLYRNAGGANFVNTGITVPGASRGSAAWGDVNNDGFPDLLLTGQTNEWGGGATRIYLNQSGASLIDSGMALPGAAYVVEPGYGMGSSWGDYDGDGDLDVLIGGWLFRNTGATSNSAPSSPTNLAFTISTNNEVILSWSPSMDAETTNAYGLSYNLRVGTTPGGGEIMAANSTVSGRRTLPAGVNAGQTNFWRLANLTNGTYFWSVQAVDSGYAGSEFATEQMFTLARPVISKIADQRALANWMTYIPFTVQDASGDPTDVTVTANSSEPSLVPATNIQVTGSSLSRTLVLHPVFNRSGRVVITLEAVGASGQVATRAFELTIDQFQRTSLINYIVPRTMAWGDIDNDGDLDVVTRQRSLINQNGTAFTEIPFATIVSGGPAWGDYDNDGWLDLLTTQTESGQILRNNRDGTFTTAAVAAPAGAATAADWGDYDNDGDLDFVQGRPGMSLVYRNDGTNGFTIDSPLVGAQDGDVAWGDYDSDGDLDLLVCGEGRIAVYENLNGTLAPLNTFLPGFAYASAAWGDIDNDGDLDFAVCGINTSPFSGGRVTRVYRNTGETNSLLRFANIDPDEFSRFVGVSSGSLRWGDYDNDGLLDLLVSGISSSGPFTNRLYRNTGSGFVDSEERLSESWNFYAWVDFDNDGRLDLSTIGNPALHRNLGAVSNSAPTAPTELSSAVSGTSVRLLWAATTDANQSGGHSYNIRVGTASGLDDVVSAMSDASGWRRVVAPGNAQQSLSRRLKHLRGGTYFWSVQAIDHSYAGSAFATEQMFTITNAAPTASALSVTTLEDTPVDITLAGSDPDGDPLEYTVVVPPMFGMLSGMAPSLSYEPLSNYFGADAFTYFVSDRTTNSAVATVSIDITPVQDLTAATLSLTRVNDGKLQLAMSGEPWQQHVIEVSEDLKVWSPLTNVISGNLTMELWDVAPGEHGQRFYRARPSSAGE